MFVQYVDALIRNFDRAAGKFVNLEVAGEVVDQRESYDLYFEYVESRLPPVMTTSIDLRVDRKATLPPAWYAGLMRVGFQARPMLALIIAGGLLTAFQCPGAEPSEDLAGSASGGSGATGGAGGRQLR